jgi:3-deoxy-manno-octulosonate cytidylyltransferase (CMP-KDO synthetase)
MNPVLMIPARMASTRLPDKPLADIGGRPMIVRVWERACAAGLGPVLVAAGEPAIAAAVTAAGGRAVLTDPDLPSGSDRIWAALQAADPEGAHDVVINLQGDLPALDPEQLKRVAAALAETGADIATLAAPIDNDADRANPAVVKAVVAWDAAERLGRALYFTRSPAPAGPGTLWHHVGLMPSAARRWRALSRCRPRPWSGARSWNSCARWRRA